MFIQRLLNRTGCPSRGGRNGESEGSGTVNAADIYFHDSIGGLVASRCGGETAQIARLAHFWNLPIVARLGSEPQLADRAFYPTLVQASFLVVFMIQSSDRRWPMSMQWR